MHHLGNNSNSVVHLSLYRRLALVGAGLLAGLVSSTPWIPAVIGLLAIGFILRSGVRLSSLALRMAAPLAMGAMALLASIFFAGTELMFQLHLGPLGLTGYRDGLERGLLVFSRVGAGAALVLFISLTTPVTEILAAAKRLRISPLFLELTGLVYRYTFVLAEEAAAVMSAQKIRLGYRTFASGLGSFGILSGKVFIRSYDRAERVAIAMKSRGLT
ncbi:MAG: cobalt ECF transporter T component CbiQ [Nitrospirota bacterium]|nr:cobalt ECF transporter T component CbiQ [Nitrospirota bacterium]